MEDTKNLTKVATGQAVAASPDDPLRSKVLSYYELIDQEKIDKVVNLFAPAATYARCEKLYNGVSEIENFYRNDRKIRGRHEIRSVWTTGQTGIVEGVFTGKGGDDSPRQVGFADFFTFDSEGKIVNRRTYLMIGGGYIQ